MAQNYYELLAVSVDASHVELHQAYRRLARLYHPDVAGEGGVSKMRELNHIWQILSDPSSRAEYDRSLPVVFIREEVPTPQPPPLTGQSRRKLWALGVQSQMHRLAMQSGRSAVQTSLLRNPLGLRSEYEPVLRSLADAISEDTEARVRSARAAGAAPLDLGVAGTLVGIRCVADELRRSVRRVTITARMKADLLDRMWDVLAHELPVGLTNALGGNPHLAKKLSVKEQKMKRQ